MELTKKRFFLFPLRARECVRLVLSLSLLYIFELRCVFLMFVRVQPNTQRYIGYSRVCPNAVCLSMMACSGACMRVCWHSVHEQWALLNSLLYKSYLYFVSFRSSLFPRHTATSLRINIVCSKCSMFCAFASLVRVVLCFFFILFIRAVHSVEDLVKW